jgi:hypothetical protein
MQNNLGSSAVFEAEVTGRFGIRERRHRRI